MPVVLLSSWLALVEEVVNYALNDSMYIILNEHWDGGWLQPAYAEQETANKHLAAIWHQIAVHFRTKATISSLQERMRYW